MPRGRKFDGKMFRRVLESMWRSISRLRNALCKEVGSYEKRDSNSTGAEHAPRHAVSPRRRQLDPELPLGFLQKSATATICDFEAIPERSFWSGLVPFRNCRTFGNRSGEFLERQPRVHEPSLGPVDSSKYHTVCTRQRTPLLRGFAICYRRQWPNGVTGNYQNWLRLDGGRQFFPPGITPGRPEGLPHLVYTGGHVTP